MLQPVKKTTLQLNISTYPKFLYIAYSVEAAPLFPELKLSMYRTQRCSRGTVVPPDVTHTTLLTFPSPKNYKGYIYV